MRLLHPRTNLLGGCGARRDQGRHSQRCDHRGRGEARMKPFTYQRAHSPAEAAAAAARTEGAKFIAGGTNLLDLMKLQIETPTHLIDVNDLDLARIESTPEG